MNTQKISFVLAILISIFAIESNAQIKVQGALTSIGTISSPDTYFNLHVGNSYAQTRFFISGGQDGANYGLGIYSAGSGSGFNGGYITTSSSHDFKLCILNQGTGKYYVGIGKSNPSCELDVAGVIKVNGITVTSDVRLKENISNVTSALGNLTRLQGVTYRLKKNGVNTLSILAASAKLDSIKAVNNDFDIYNRDHIGFLAQDVQKIYPELVYTDNDGMLSVDYLSLIPVLVESIKAINSKQETDSADFQKQIAVLNDKIKSDSISYEKRLKQLTDKIDQIIEAQKSQGKLPNNTGASLNPEQIPNLFPASNSSSGPKTMMANNESSDISKSDFYK